MISYLIESNSCSRYGYAVQDDEGNDFNQQEQSDGNTVSNTLNTKSKTSLNQTFWHIYPTFRSRDSTLFFCLTVGFRLSPTVSHQTLALWWVGNLKFIFTRRLSLTRQMECSDMIPDKWFPHHRLRWPTRRRGADFGNYQKACIDWMIDWRLILSRWYISSRISYRIIPFLLLLYFLLKRACHMFWYYTFSPRFEMNHIYLLPKFLTYHKTLVKLYEKIQCTIL